MRHNTLRLALLILLLGITLMPVNLYADLAKIHRKHAKLTLNPAVVTSGTAFTAAIEPYQEHDWALIVQSPKGDRMLKKELGSQSITAEVLTLPEGVEGSFTVVLGIQWDDYFQTVDSQPLVILPNYQKDLHTAVERLEAIEKASAEKKVLLRETWAALAFAEDLAERMKKAETGDVWDLTERLKQLNQRVEALEQGKEVLQNTSGYQLRGYRSPMNEEVQLYSFYLPKNYDESKPWPLVVMLHGAWSNHHLALRRVFGLSNRPGEDDAAAKKSMPELPDVPYLVVAPNGYETMSYEGFAEEDVWRVIEEVKTLYNVDPDRMYLTGLSMGGAGTGKLGLRYPDRWAAIAPVCGFFGPWNYQQTGKKSESQNRIEDLQASIAIAENALHLPVKLMHGDADQSVSVRFTQDLTQRLKDLDYTVDTEIYPGVQHDAWVNAYKDTRIFEWFGQYTRDPYPRKVIYKTGDPKGGSSYWVQIDEPAQIRRFAQVEAEAESDRIEIKTDNVERLTLEIPYPLYAEKNSVQIYINNQSLGEGTYQGEVHNYALADGLWKRVDAPEKRLLPGISGIYEVMQDNHTYYVGMSTNKHPVKNKHEEITQAGELAFAKSLTATIHDVQWQVLAEIYMNEGKTNGNIVLFSTWDASSFLHQYADRFPVKVTDPGWEIGGKPIDKNQGLVFIYPNPASPEHYVVICTALNLEGLKALKTFASFERTLQLDNPGDIVVYNPDGSVAATGLFDKNWQVESLDFVAQK